MGKGSGGKPKSNSLDIASFLLGMLGGISILGFYYQYWQEVYFLFITAVSSFFGLLLGYNSYWLARISGGKGRALAFLGIALSVIALGGLLSLLVDMALAQ